MGRLRWQCERRRCGFFVRRDSSPKARWAARELAQRLGINIAASNGHRRNGSAAKNRNAPAKPLTLAEFADAKKLPVDWLREQGIGDIPEGAESYPGIGFGYFQEDGSQHVRIRRRTSLGRNGWSWIGTGGVAPIAYGAWRLGEARKDGDLIVLEGESDTLTCWLHKWPALGLPGASMANTLDAKYLVDIIRIFIHHEPDKGGDTFVTKVAARLRELRFAGEVKEFGIAGFKDPSNLHIDDPEAFDARLASALKGATPINIETLESPKEAECYRETSAGISRVELKGSRGNEAELLHPLTNFTARIVADVSRDDGAEATRAFEIEAHLGERSATFTVPASHFAGMRWPTEHMGAQAVVYAGHGTADHARTAIQLLSRTQTARTIFTHTGWRKIGDAWIYLHTGGGIGEAGPVAGVEVELPPELSSFRLELPADPIPALRASLRVLDLGPDRITVPAYGAIWRALLGGADFSVFVYGLTGTFKTETAALHQQHFGAGFDARHLPTSFTSTANVNEALAFVAKDAVLTVDELHPPASGNEREQMHRDAARLLRSQGNSAGRGRMRADGTLRPSKPPRGLMLATGEELPRGQSVFARLFTVEMRSGDIDVEKLSACQIDANAGLYSQATATFVRWLAARLPAVREEFETLRCAVRAQVRHDHARTADIHAQLIAACSVFSAFLLDVGAIDEAGAARFQSRVGAALQEVATTQTQYTASVEPTGAFFRLLGSAIGAGRAHVADRDGNASEGAEKSSGWRDESVGPGEFRRVVWRPHGDRVGWLDGDALYLDRDAAYRVAQGMSIDGTGIEVTATTLARRLRDRHMLVTIDPARETLTVRRVLEGRQRDVLHLSAKVLGVVPPKPDKPDKPDNPAQKADENVGSDVGLRVGK